MCQPSHPDRKFTYPEHQFGSTVLIERQNLKRSSSSAPLGGVSGRNVFEPLHPELRVVWTDIDCNDGLLLMDSITTAGDCAGSSGGRPHWFPPRLGARRSHTHTPHTPIAETRLGLNQQPLNREATLLPLKQNDVAVDCGRFLPVCGDRCSCHLLSTFRLSAKMAEDLQMEHLEPSFPVLEQGLSHHDNALREVRKYSNADQTKDAKLHPNMFDHMHMKLFRAQRNLYISGFSLFLWLVMRRVITLINQLAGALGTSAALQTQAESANKAAKKYMEDNEMLKQALVDTKGEGGKKQDTEENKLLKKEVQRLTEELKSSADALKKSKSDLDAMKKQTEGLTKEYDRLLQEHQELQNQPDSGDKKDN
ncbi:unnamed protein product [Leuciscus chuanchicus]